MTHTFLALPNRGLLGLSGSDSLAFLNSVCTQKVLPGVAVHYAAHLTPQGRFLFDFFIYQPEENLILLECAHDTLMNLARSLHTYAIGQKVEFGDASADYQVLVALNNGDAAAPLQGTLPTGALHGTDPRHPQLGTRILCPQTTPHTASTNAQPYETRRIQLGIPDCARDAQHGKTLTAELGLEYLNGVHFAKGCYVGQEMTARMHFRTQPKKKLYQVIFDVGSPLPALPAKLMHENTEVSDINSAAEINGVVTGLAIIHERFAERSLTCNGCAVSIKLPAWWGDALS